MNKRAGLRALLLGLLAVPSCYASAGTGVSSGYVVYHNPPYNGAVWSSGYWNWTGNQWMWMDGYWLAPQPGYVYVQPYWARRGSGWAFSRGYWRSARTPHPRYAPVYRYPSYRDRGPVYRGGATSRGPAYRAPTRLTRGTTVYRQPYAPRPRSYTAPMGPRYRTDRGNSFRRAPIGIQRHQPSPRVYAPRRAPAPGPRMNSGFRGGGRGGGQGRAPRR